MTYQMISNILLTYNRVKNRLGVLLYLYRARNKVTQLSIPTHAQIQCH